MTTAQNRSQDAAIVALLRALPETRLEGILEALGVATVDLPQKLDPRRCRHCGKGFVTCRKIAELGDPHDWQPDRTRTGEPT